MLKTTPLIKGIITGAAILIITLLLGYFKVPAQSGAHYLIYALYGAGTGWTLYDYSRSPGYKGKFGDLFGQGFRCFIVVTLIMVMFTLIYVSLNPAFGDEMASLYREDLVKQNELTPDKINEQVGNYRKGFTTTMVSMTIFQYLVLGAIFTAAWSALILLRKKMQPPAVRS